MARTKPVERPQFSTNAKRSGLHEELPYKNQGYILSEGERRFYRQGLLPAIGNRYLILMKVRLTDVIAVPPELWRAAAGRKVQQRHLDFVLVTKKRLRIVMAIELDDASHLAAEQQAKDAYLDDALHAAGISLIRLPIYRRYDPIKLRGIVGRVVKNQATRIKFDSNSKTVLNKRGTYSNVASEN